MTKKDYILIASSLRAQLKVYEDSNSILPEYSEGFYAAVKAITIALKSDNPNFDERRFIDAVVKE